MIGHGVELGANVILLGDITIGTHVTIGAGSVVLDSIPTMRWWWEKSTGEGQHMNILGNLRTAGGRRRGGVALDSIRGRCKRADVTFVYGWR